MVDWCTGGGAASKIVVSTLLVKFELIQKHNKPFVYTLTAHFSSSAASFMCWRTISSPLCAVVAFLLLLRCVFYQHWWWWWWSSSSVLGLCVRCACLLLLFSLFLCSAQCFSLSYLCCAHRLLRFFCVFLLHVEFVCFFRESCVASAFRPCTRFSPLPFRCALATALTHYCDRCGMVRIVARAQDSYLPNVLPTMSSSSSNSSQLLFWYWSFLSFHSNSYNIFIYGYALMPYDAILLFCRRTFYAVVIVWRMYEKW